MINPPMKGNAFRIHFGGEHKTGTYIHSRLELIVDKAIEK